MFKIIVSTKSKAGFSLLEIIVVIAVIGILSAVAYASFSDARAQARDKQRMNDLAMLQLAITLYYHANGTYQISGGGWRGEGQGWVSYTNPPDNYNKSITQVLYEEGFISSPDVKDPRSPDPGYMFYLCEPDGDGNFHAYSLSATKEVPLQSDIDYAKTVCNSDTIPGNIDNSIVATYGKNYAVGNVVY